VPAAKNLFAQNTTLYAYWKPAASRATVTLTLNSLAYPNRTVALYQSGAQRYLLDDPDAANFGVTNGVYDVYVDGAMTDKQLTVNGGDVSTAIDYYTARANTTIDGQPAQVGDVTLRSGVFGALTAVWTGSGYTTPIHPYGSDNTWRIYVDGADTGHTLDMGNVSRRAETVPYYNATMNLIYDSDWTDAAVTLRQGGDVKYYLPYSTTSAAIDEPGETQNTYQKAILGDTGADAASDTYRVFVNGADTGRTLALVKDSMATWAAKAEYYEAAVAVTRDDDPWMDTRVELWRGGALAYALGYDAIADAYREPHARKYDEDSYDVRVSGSISGADTGVKVTEASPKPPAIAYFLVKYDDKNSDYLTQTVRAGLTAAEPTPPYHAGSTFKGWYTNATPSDTDPAYVFATAVNDHLDLFAVYDIPAVVIGGYVKCDADGTQNGSGGYYRMMNLTVRGFRPTGTPINSVTLTVENSVIAFYPLDSTDNYEVLNSIDAATGNGSLSVIFTGAGGLTMNEVQQFLRTNVIVQVKDTGLKHRMRVTVYGMTS
jgi:hypothetical protein